MSSEPHQAPSAPPATPAPQASGVQRAVLALLGVVAVAGLATSVMLWQRLGSIQEQLARQSADAGAQSIEARTLANQALDMARDVSARIAVNETRVSEVALQRSQLEELMQSLSRSRDENLVVDIESALRLAQQQAQLTGSLEPVMAALKSASQRIERAAQPRLAPVARAIGRDLDRVGSAQVTDTAGLLARLDDLMRQVDELPLQNAVAQAAATRRMNAAARPSEGPAAAGADGTLPWWQATLQRAWEVVRDEARQLLRVTRIDRPEAILIAPDQAFFLRENLKLQLMNARLALLARQYESARADLSAANNALGRYFDPASRRTQTAAAVLQQAQVHLKGAALPTLDETFAALATAAAGR
ncbi:uroporphyrinogen-III C-methyltransferase [Paracidovorax cattleyae]|uniref:Uroporphyrin-3 C-methyltransferase n=2 Tax=Paracidovorax cattleyae TaxID=80868 RepID=A0A1H0NIP5_9BURK|nr:uroporphyrinogen-III C-methyltransferase [Paracidovorax cattleyae]SDO92539.1 uroporphyrin-3 C-methyltransferase [Paracidovorax cattleyae]